MRATDLAERLGRQAEQVAAMLLPTGKRVGSEWRAGTVDGDPGKSLGVHLDGEKAGWWKDFDSGDGGDLIGLWMATRRLTLAAACKEASDYLGIRDDRPAHHVRSWKHPDREGVQRLSDSHAAWLRDVRKIPDATVQAYKLASRGERMMFPFLRDGELVFAKYRTISKQFSADGGCEPILFGWQAIPDQARAVIITEGELDACAWHAYGYPALSVPTGATGHAWIESEYSRLELFDTIYLSMDSDDAGQKGVAELCARLGRDRCKVINLPRKDANDCLIHGVMRDVMMACIRDARTNDPAELRNAGEFEDAVVAEIGRVDDGMLLPWSKTHGSIKLRPGELSVWAGVNGHGKSQCISQIVASLATCGSRCCVASMEWRTPKWLLRMTRQIGAVESPTESYARAIIRALSSTLWTFDVAGSAKAERILEVFKYARRRYKIDLFVIDNLTKCGFADDDYPAQKLFVETLADFARRSDCHVILVAHMRKSESEDHVSGKFGVKGSGGITDMAQTVVEIWRNKARERAMLQAAANPTVFPLDAKFDAEGKLGMDAMLVVHKQNETGEEPMVRLWFDKRTGQFLGNHTHRARSMLPLAGLATASSA